MKDKILYVILGILIGAVITAGCFLAYSKTSGSSEMPSDGMRGGSMEKGERPDGAEDIDFENQDFDIDDSTTEIE